MNQIRLPASKLASCIGLNQYVTIHDAVFELVNCRGMNTVEKLALRDQLSQKSKDELCNALGIGKDSSISEINQQLQKECYKVAKNNEDSKVFIDKLSDTTIQSAILGEFNKKAGVVWENKDLDRVEQKKGIKIEQRNSVMNHIIINLDKDTELKITGRIDGYCPQEDCIIETKHRKNRLFRKVPEYERVQCELYMRMFNVSKVYHTETFREESVETLLEKDDAFWNRILKLLKKDFYPLYCQYKMD